MELQLNLISYPNKIFWIHFTAKMWKYRRKLSWLTDLQSFGQFKFNILPKSETNGCFPLQKMLFPLSSCNGCDDLFWRAISNLFKRQDEPLLFPHYGGQKVLRSLLKKIKSAEIQKRFDGFMFTIIFPICLRAKAGLCSSGQ